MALSSAVQGATHTAQRITWTDGEGDAQDLTGATITAWKQRRNTATSTAVTGTMSVVAPATSGVFTWPYSTADVATAGKYLIQFTATYGDGTKDRTLIEDWEVEKSIPLP